MTLFVLKDPKEDGITDEDKQNEMTYFSLFGFSQSHRVSIQKYDKEEKCE